MCTYKGCPLFKIDPEIKCKKTLCLRKMHVEHTCTTSRINNKVTSNQVAKVCELRIDSKTMHGWHCYGDYKGKNWS